MELDAQTRNFGYLTKPNGDFQKILAAYDAESVGRIGRLLGKKPSENKQVVMYFLYDTNPGKLGLLREGQLHEYESRQIEMYAAEKKWKPIMVAYKVKNKKVLFAFDIDNNMDSTLEKVFRDTEEAFARFQQRALNTQLAA